MLKRKSIFYNQIAIDFFGFRNLDRDSKAYVLAQKLDDATKSLDGNVVMSYATRVFYTDEMNFDWAEEVPGEFKNLEKWWSKIVAGEPDVECYMFWRNNIPNALANMYHEALDDAHKIWKPTNERMIPDNEKESADPKE